jgi:two-component system, chemotaxis family, sensor kinase Cph1
MTADCAQSQIDQSQVDQSQVDQFDDEMLYVRELLHRISNEYTNAIFFARYVAAGCSSEEAKTAVGKIAAHLHALTSSHRALYPPERDEPADLTDDLSALCRAMTAAWLAPQGITLKLAAPRRILLQRKSCWRACLIVSELIRNAGRHGSYLDHGHIGVSIDVVSDRVLCRVSDDGASAPTYVPGRGTRLVDALADELEGSVEREFGKSGASVVLSFPMRPIMLDEQAIGEA